MIMNNHSWLKWNKARAQRLQNYEILHSNTINFIIPPFCHIIKSCKLVSVQITQREKEIKIALQHQIKFISPSFQKEVVKENAKIPTSQQLSPISHSVPIASTIATYFVSEPLFFNLTCVQCSTECAFVKTLLPLITKPLLLELYCRFLCQGSEKLGSV